MLKKFLSRLRSFMGNTKTRYTMGAIAMIMIGAVAGLVQGSFAESSPTKTTATRTSAPAAPQHITVNPMGTAANDPNADSETANSQAATTPSKTAATNNSLDFTVNPPSEVNLSDGNTPTVAASTDNEQPVYWTVSSNSSYIQVKSQTSPTAKTARLLFTVSKATADVPANTYTITITASLPGNASVSHTISVSVPQMTPFTVSARTQDHSKDSTATTIYLPFEITPNSDSQLTNVVVKSSDATANPAEPGIQVLDVKDTGTGTDGSLLKAVEVQVPVGYSGTIDVTVTVSMSDGSSSTTLPMSYTMNTSAH